MMAGVTMCASTFLNAQQIDYDEFRKETLEMVAFARQHQPQTSAYAAGASGHA